MPAAKKSAPTAAPTAKPAVSHSTNPLFSSSLNRILQAGKNAPKAPTAPVPAVAAPKPTGATAQAKPSPKAAKK